MRRLVIITLIFFTSIAASWKSEGPFFGNVLSITVDPANANRLWVSTHGGGVWSSADGGKSWQLAGAELSGYVVSYVVFQPESKETIWAGVEQSALARSKDGGKTWEWMRDDLAHTPHPLAFDPANPKSIWIPDVNLHKRSADGGAKWTEFRVSGGDVMTFEFHPTDSKIIWAGGSNGRAGLWKSIDGGASWRQTGKGLPESNRTRDLIVDPSDPNHLYMAAFRGGYKSTDGGDSWTPFGSGFPQSTEIESLTIHPTSPKTLYAGTEKGFFRTTDGGANWSAITGAGLPRYVISALAIHPTSPDTMWAGLSAMGIYKSSDGGKTWNASNAGFAASWVDQVWGDASGTIFAETNVGLYRNDGKGGWSEVLQPFSDDEADLDSLLFDAKNPKTIHAGRGWTYYRSSDGGNNWTEVSKPFQDPSPGFDSIVVDAKNPKILYSADAGADAGEPSVFKSVDGGVKWKPASKGLAAKGVLALRDSAGALFALGKEHGFWKSADGAMTWTAIGGGLPSEDLRDLAMDPTDPSRMYVLSKKVLYRSDDGGATFSSAHQAEKESELFGTAVDAKGNVYVGTGEGVFRSTDGGETWSPFNDGLTNTDVRALYSAGTRLYGGTAGGGVFSIALE